MTAMLAEGLQIRRTALLGAALTVFNTLLSVSADAIAKDLIGSYAAPQLMALSGALAVGLGLLLAGAGQAPRILATGAPRLLALRSALGALSTVCFFYALRYLAFSEVFLFIAIMPVFAAILSGLVLRERLGQAVWGALALGVLGMVAMLPEGPGALSAGHWIGLAASLSGSASIVLSRRICRSHTHAMAQVFYAQLACLILGLCLLPLVWQPMAPADLALLAVYTLFLVSTRWLMVVIVRLLPAYIVLQLANLQFIWMVVLGHAVFGESTGPHIWLGTALVVGSGLWLLHSQQRKPA